VRRWILVTSSKGGVGKSLVARLLAETKREVEPATWLLDGDGEVGQLAQYLGTRDEHGKIVRGQRGDSGVDTFALHSWRDDSGMRDVIEGLVGPLRAARQTSSSICRPPLFRSSPPLNEIPDSPPKQRG